MFLPFEIWEHIESFLGKNFRNFRATCKRFRDVAEKVWSANVRYLPISCKIAHGSSEATLSSNSPYLSKFLDDYGLLKKLTVINIDGRNKLCSIRSNAKGENTLSLSAQHRRFLQVALNEQFIVYLTVW